MVDGTSEVGREGEGEVSRMRGGERDAERAGEGWVSSNLSRTKREEGQY